MADLIDFKMVDGQIVFDETGDIVFIRGAERIRQQIEMRLSLWAGEWFLDATFGTPYLVRVLGKTATIDAAVDALRQQVADVDGVDAITRFDYTFDARTRQLNVDLEALSEFGIVKYQSIAQLEADPNAGLRTYIDMRAATLDPRVVVNSMPAHGIRMAGNYLGMTADGDYPVEMVDNVEVGRQLPVAPLTAADLTGSALTNAESNPLFMDSPGGGLPATLVGATATAVNALHYVEYSYDGTGLTVGDMVRVDVFVKNYDGQTNMANVDIVQDTTVLASCTVNPVDGSFNSKGYGVKDTDSVVYGGGWWRFTYTIALTQAVTSYGIRVSILNAGNSASYIAQGGYKEALLIAHPVLAQDIGAIQSVRPEGVNMSPAGSVSIVKMYGAPSVRAIMSNGTYYDLDFGDADHVDLPVNPYDVGDAFITRIEYRG